MVAGAVVVTGAALVPDALRGMGGSPPAPQDSVTTVPREPSLVGSWQRVVDQASSASWDGRWVMRLGAGGILDLAPPPSAAAVATDGVAFDVAGDRFRSDAFVNGACPDAPAGVYRWFLSGERLTLQPVAEPCPLRAEVFAGTWTSVSVGPGPGAS